MCRARSWYGLGLLGVVGLGAASATGCTSEDDWVVRPPGGGSGSGSGSGVDAGSDSGSGLLGRVCVIDDLRAPDLCPTTADARGVQIHVVGGATVTTTDARGSFTLPAATGALVIEVAATAGLVAATVRVDVGTGPLQVPVARASSWQETLDSVSVPGLAGLGAIVIYVDDAGGAPLEGATFTAQPGAAYPVFYDDGGAARWRTDAGTGVAGVALMLGVPAVTQTVAGAAPGPRAITLTGVPVRADAVTFVRTLVP